MATAAAAAERHSSSPGAKALLLLLLPGARPSSRLREDGWPSARLKRRMQVFRGFNKRNQCWLRVRQDTWKCHLYSSVTVHFYFIQIETQNSTNQKTKYKQKTKHVFEISCGKNVKINDLQIYVQLYILPLHKHLSRCRCSGNAFLCNSYLSCRWQWPQIQSSKVKISQSEYVNRASWKFQTKFGWVGEMWMFFFYKSLSIDLLAIWQWYEIISVR